MASSSLNSSMAIVGATNSSVAILRTKEKAAILNTSCCLLLPPAGVYTQLCIQRCCQALKIVVPATEYKSIPPYRLTLTTTKSPVIPDTLLGCQSYWTCQNNCLTTGFCEAEDKAEPLNKNQIHRPTVFIHVAFFLSPPPSRSAWLVRKKVQTPHPFS